MITRERLAELIEQESGCYVLNDHSIGYVHLKLKYEPELYVNGKDGYILYIYCNDKKDYKEEIFDEDLFETEEEAEWHREFGCIERTERLELPTWEESKKCDTICHFDDVEFDYFEHDNTYGLYEDCYKLLDLEATKENYTLACRKCKELFLGKDS